MRRPITRNISTLYDPWKNCSQTIVSSFRMYVGFHNRKRVPLAEQELPCLITPVGFVLTFLLWRIAYSHVFHSMLWCTLQYPRKKRCLDSYLLPFVLSGFHLILMLSYEYYCTTRFPFLIMFVGFNSNTMGVTSEDGISNLSEAPF